MAGVYLLCRKYIFFYALSGSKPLSAYLSNNDQQKISDNSSCTGKNICFNELTLIKKLKGCYPSKG